MQETRFAIFDPDQGKFLSSGSEPYGLNPELVWTDKPRNIWSNMAYDDLPGRLKRVIDKHPNAYIAEIEVSITTWKPAVREEVPLDVRYAKEIATYNELLPMFEADADGMRKKDWLAFRAAHSKLREIGYPVCGGLGPVPQRIVYR